MTDREHEIQARQDADDYDRDEQLQSLELCACNHTRGAHARLVRKGEYVAPCALCPASAPCNDFRPEDYVPLDNSQDTVTMSGYDR